MFCYGSNGPRQLADRINIDQASVEERIVPVKLQGWKRAFANRAGGWGNASTATLFKTNDKSDETVGIAFKMTAEEIEELDPYEGYPWKYDRKEVNMLGCQSKDESGNPVWTPLPGQAYI